MRYSMSPYGMKYNMSSDGKFLRIKLDHGEVLQKGWQEQIPYDLDKCDHLFVIGGNLGDECLTGCPFKKITVGDTESFGDGVFRDCSALEEVGLHGCPDVDTMGKRAFENCYNLRRIAFPSNLRTIEADTFTNCESLAKPYVEGGYEILYLPSTLQAVDADAFKGCSSLKRIQVGARDAGLFSRDIALQNEKALGHLKQLGNSGSFLPEGASLEYCIDFEQGPYGGQWVDFGDYVRGIKSIAEILEEASKAYEKSEYKEWNAVFHKPENSAMSRFNAGISSDYELPPASYELPSVSSEHSAMSRFNAGMSSDELSQVSSESVCNMPMTSFDDFDL